MSQHHNHAPLSDLAAKAAEEGATVENVETVETQSGEFNEFHQFNATPPAERIHPVPEDSILADVRDIGREFSEAPDSFTIAPFLTLIGGVLTPRCYFDFGGQKFCNLFQFVVGPPGIRKSTSFRIPEKIGRMAVSPDSFHSGNASDSAAFQKWKQQPHRIQLESEGNTTIISWRGSYAGREIAARYLKLYDGESWSQTFRHQETEDGKGAEQHIDCATLSLAIGATPAVCRFDGVDAKSGLRRRFGYYTADRTAREIDWPRPLEDGDLATVVRHVERITELEGQFTLDKGANGIWKDLQRSVRAKMAEIGGESSEEAEIRLAELAETPSRVLKLAGIFQVCRWVKIQGSPFTVDANTLSLAVEHQFACLEASRAVDQIAHRAANAEEARKVLDTIRSEARFKDGRWSTDSGIIVASKSDVTRRFAANGGHRALTTSHLHNNIMPLVIRLAGGTTEVKGATTVYRIPQEA